MEANQASISNLCSRRLWELLLENQHQPENQSLLESELRKRRHYLPELKKLAASQQPFNRRHTTIN